MAGLEKQREQYKTAVDALAIKTSTRLILVARAQQATLREVTRTHEELAAVGFQHQYLVINGILPRTETDNDPLAAAIHERERTALNAFPEALKALPCDELMLWPGDANGQRRRR